MNYTEWQRYDTTSIIVTIMFSLNYKVWPRLLPNRYTFLVTYLDSFNFSLYNKYELFGDVDYKKANRKTLYIDQINQDWLENIP